jgi:hypothetical protein
VQPAVARRTSELTTDETGAYGPREPVRVYTDHARTRAAECPALLRLSAVKLSAAIRERRVTAELAATTYIKRIKEVNPLLNHMVRDRFVLAVAEARCVPRIPCVAGPWAH